MIKTSLGVQRYNNRMDKVWAKAIEAKQKYCEHKLDKESKCEICGLVDSVYNKTGICQDIPR